MVTVDASVWVAIDADDEEAAGECRDFLASVLARRQEVHQPTLTVVEVCAAVARRTGDEALSREAGARLLRFPSLTVHPLDLEASGLAAALAAEARLRGADAVYAATARRHGTVLVTLDRELLERSSQQVTTATPAEWLQGGAGA